MALITFNCTKCGQKLSADKTLSASMTVCPVCSQQIKIPEFRLYTGMRLGEFILKEQLGIGGMGEVWMAEQTSMQRSVALKILSPSLSSNPDFCVRFQNEAKNSGRLLHPNIVTAFAAGMEDDIHYLAMAYIDGVPLETELELCHRLQENQTLKIILDVAEALQYAWDKFKIIHRDLKPSNIMITRLGNAMILDLGISKSLIDQATNVTRSGIFVGTPYYISPEQARNDLDLDCRADIYSLGAVLYHMLSGHVPFNATTPMGIVARHLSEPLPDLRTIRPRISEPIISLIDRMMKKKKEQRYDNWAAVIDAIHRIQAGKHSKVIRAEHFLARHRTGIAAGIMVGLTLAVAAAVTLSVIRKPSLPPLPAAGEDLEVSETAAAGNAWELTPGNENGEETTEGNTVTATAAAPGDTAAASNNMIGPRPTTAVQNRLVNDRRLLDASFRFNILPMELSGLKTLLDLSPEQVKQMTIIIKYAREQLFQVREKMRYADNTYKLQLQKEIIKIRQETAYQLKELLTENQLKKWNELEKARKNLRAANAQSWRQPPVQHSAARTSAP